MLLSAILAIGGPLLQICLKLIPVLYQFKILKTEAEIREWERRFKEAIKQSEASAKDPVSAQTQYRNAKEAAKAAWNKRFGGGQ